MSSVNGARQGRSTTVSRGRVHMWTRLGTHHAPRDGQGERRGARGMRWDGMQRVHNGYVRQGWILLINPTGYIVPPARDEHTPLRPNPPRSRSNAPRRCAGAPLLQHTARSSTFYSPPFPRHESGILLSGWVVSSTVRLVCASLLYHSHYACLRQRRYRSVVPCDVRTFRFLCLEKNDGEARRNGTRRSGELPWDDYRSRSLAGGGRCSIRGN